MKKYLLTALLWVFGLFGFASADTVWNFTSDSEICTYSFSDSSYVDVTSLSQCGVSDNYWNWIFDFYACLDSDDSWFVFWWTINWNDWDYYTPTLPFCFSLEYGDVSLEFYNPSSDFENNDFIEEYISWKIYYSTSPVTYSSSSGGWDSWTLLPWWEGDLSWIISWLNSVIDEFLPYLVYIWLGLITSTIWFIAVRWLVGRTSSKVRWTFSSWKRKR